MAQKVNVNKLADTILKEMKNYTDGVEKQIHDKTAIIGANAVKELKNGPAIPISTKDQKHYKRSFYIKKKEYKKYKITRYWITNRKYQIGHLLEFGYLTRKGTRTKAFPHWKKAEEKVIKETKKMIKELQ